MGVWCKGDVCGDGLHRACVLWGSVLRSGVIRCRMCWRTGGMANRYGAYGLDWSKRREDETPGDFRARMARESLEAAGGVVDGTVDGGEFAGKKAALSGGERELVTWVFDHMDIKGVSAGDAPSAGAWSLLQQCRRSGTMREAFYLTIWPKLLPTRGTVDAEDERRRGGGKALEHVERVMAAAVLARSLAGVAGEN